VNVVADTSRAGEVTDWMMAAFARDRADGIDPAQSEQGWAQTDTRVTLVCGPPGSGKSTYVETAAGPDDVIVDYDRLVAAFHVGPSHRDGMSEAAQAARGAVLNRVRAGRLSAGRVWLVSANPNAELLFPHHDRVLLDPGRDVAVERCRAAGRPLSWLTAVDDWYDNRKVPA